MQARPLPLRWCGRSQVLSADSLVELLPALPDGGLPSYLSASLWAQLAPAAEEGEPVASPRGNRRLPCAIRWQWDLVDPAAVQGARSARGAREAAGPR